MHPRAEALFKQLALEPHPEGGYYRRIWSSSIQVQVSSQPGLRSALSTIYFLLVAGNHSRWHRMSSDEIWHFYEGDPLELFKLEPQTLALDRYQLGPAGPTHQPVQAIPASHWLAARTSGSYTLVGCSVAPAFEFAGFQMLVDDPQQSARLRQHRPEVADLI